MRPVRTIQLVYFSGTGGTAIIAESFEKSFMEKGITVRKAELPLKTSITYDADLLLILFPVYAFNAPELVEDWISALSTVQNKLAAVLSVSGGGDITPNTACRVRVIRQLKRKGFGVFYENMLVMPSNFYLEYSDIVSAMLLKAVPLKTKNIAEEFLAGKRRRTKPFILDRLLSRIGLVERVFARSLFGKNLKAGSNCTGCAWCAKQCPRNNIHMKNSRPVFSSKCLLCLRCIYGCPQKAIMPGLGDFIVIKNGYNLKKLESRTSDIKKFPPVASVTKGILLVGVRKYLKEFYS